MESLLSIELTKKVNIKIKEIAETLYKSDIQDCSLMYGKAGIAIFLFYYWKWKKQNSFYKKSSEFIYNIFLELNKQIYLYKQRLSEIDLSFYTGLSGIGWSINHLVRNNFIESDIQETMCLIDAAIYRKMIDGLYSENKDVFFEAILISIYTANRQDRFSKEYLRRFINEWLDMEKKGTGFFSNQKFINESKNIQIMWDIIIKKQPEIVPVLIKEKIKTGNTYNDDDMLLNKLNENALVLGVDSGLENGLAKNAFVAIKYYLKTGIVEFKEVAEDSIDKLFKITNYKDKRNSSDFWLTSSRGIWSTHDGFINGLAGIGLVLLYALTGIDSGWDEPLVNVFDKV
ncbi:MAG: hypothetical protein LBG80_00405 [Bacteroidales bacterium]|jgi:hypothetical protein|nr:hypothetical protein [Bacteroidales bacterium]